MGIIAAITTITMGIIAAITTTTITEAITVIPTVEVIIEEDAAAGRGAASRSIC